MKNLSLLLFLSAILAVGCDKNDLRLNADTLHYDGSNFAAPQLPAGEYEAAVRFTFGKLERFVGKQLYEVNLYLQSVPADVRLNIYGKGDENKPGQVLYTANLDGLNQNSWNDHYLSTPVDITGEDLWISLRFMHPQDMRSIGCDPGPANDNGDHLLDYETQEWTNLRDFSSGVVDINWNIRGQVTKE